VECRIGFTIDAEGAIVDITPPGGERFINEDWR
jgi:hypothetical protein